MSLMIPFFVFEASSVTSTALKSSWQAGKAAFKRDREKHSCPLELILQQKEGGGGWGAAGQPGPRCAFGTDLCNVDPKTRGQSQPGTGLGAVVVPLVLLCT